MAIANTASVKKPARTVVWPGGVRGLAGLSGAGLSEGELSGGGLSGMGALLPSMIRWSGSQSRDGLPAATGRG